MKKVKPTRKFIRWTKEEEAILIEKYATVKAADIATELRRTKKGIMYKARKLGLNAEHRENTGAFKKGQKPWNKGLKNVNGYSSTRWKKGESPRCNAKKIGETWAVNCKGTYYVYIKTERGRELYSHYLWRQRNGKEVPEGYIIRHKDGNTTNHEADNLMCISRAENVRMNHNAKKASRTMKISKNGGYFNAVLNGLV